MVSASTREDDSTWQMRPATCSTKTEVAAEYTKPDVADYGDLEELTARAGAAFTDSSLGGPNGSRSTP